ncbi:MAG: DMT family transporter [Pseudomonadota bacterium]
MPLHRLPARRATGTLMVVIGVLTLSLDGLLIRLVGASGPDILFWRGLFMVIALTVVVRLMTGQWITQRLRGGGRDTPWVVGCFALTNFLFVFAVLNTAVANAVVILAASPLFAALLSGWLLKEWIPVRTWIAMAVVFAGIVGVFAGSLETGGLLGDALALAAAFIIGLKLTLLRRSPDIDRIAAIGTGGLLGALVALPLAAPLAVGGASLALLAAMGSVQMPLALVLIALATHHLPAGEVAMFLVLEAVFGSLWVWWVLAEAPPPATLIGGTLVLVTLAVHSWLAWREDESGIDMP